MNHRRIANIYLFGIFVSSLGSMTYLAGVASFMPTIGLSTLFIGTLFFINRTTSFFVSTLFGHIGDIFEPRLVILGSEMGALCGSLLILLAWIFHNEIGMIPFLAANVFRVFFTNLQSSSVQKHGSLLDRNAGLEGMTAIYLNWATSGTLLFSGLIAWAILRFLSFNALILFDAITFLINGFLIYLFQSELYLASPANIESHTQRKLINFNLFMYSRNHRNLALQDLALALSQCGANTLIIRLLSNQTSLIPFGISVFGGTVWISSYINKKLKHNVLRVVWPIYGLILALEGFYADYPFRVLGLCFFGYLCYWILFNSISRQLMSDSEMENYAQISAARSASNMLINSTGELWVGAARISINLETLWRGALVALGAFKVHPRKSRT